MYTRIETLSCFIFILKQAYRYTRLLVFSLSRGTFDKKVLEVSFSWTFPFCGEKSIELEEECPWSGFADWRMPSGWLLWNSQTSRVQGEEKL
jgi:hypothetical protein